MIVSPRRLLSLGAVCVAAHAVSSSAHADAWRSSDQVLSLELSSGIYAPTVNRLERRFGTGFSGRATLHASMRPNGKAWFAWSVGYRRDEGELLTTPDTFELDDATFHQVPMTLGMYWDITGRSYRSDAAYPLTLHGGGGVELLWVDWSIPEAVPADDVGGQFVFGPYLELVPMLDAGRYRFTFRTRATLHGGADYDSVILDDVNFSGLQVELGVMRRFN